MSDDAWEVVSIVGVGVLITAVCLAIGWWISWAKCHSQWEHSGMTAISWGPIQGCLVKLPDGRWLPADRIREIDISRAEKASK